MRRRPGDVYGCPCGSFTMLVDTQQQAEALAASLRLRNPDREVVVDYE